MGRTIVEKILQAHTNDEVKPDRLIEAKVDFAFANDITAPLAIEDFKLMGAKKVFDPERIALIPDHFTPNKDVKSAEQAKIMKEFAKEFGIKYYFEIGRGGIEHVLLHEEGLTLPGDIIIGADSHTCTYGALGCFATGVGSTDLAAAWALGKLWFKVPRTIKFNYKGKLRKWVGGKDLILFTIGQIGVDGALYRAMEFSGEVIRNLPMDDRFTMCNMAIEAGAKCGIIEPDEKTIEYVKGRAKREYKIFNSDPDAEYEKIYEWDVSELEPQVALPHLPSNVKGVSGVKGVKVDQVVIGSCTNGRLRDLAIAAEILKGKKVHPDVRVIIFPGTQKVYMEAMKLGYIQTFIESGAAVSTPTCGPCLGGHMGVLAKGEICVSTTNRNFIGRMGHKESYVYLASPAVAAASAIAGEIVSPEEVMK
ncbi:MAG: 3-isopropylmalate dehydratase large subunit [Synergistetes bacterium]|nr:MAG: 3-isopropylmalate dehydratase large subunit [bacterium 42_11]MBC7331720.1 3-isopropylmalate dehydratase large subunit [Synergistota bacterium]MDK2870757.1 3-isopropylmalate/(R)-2-methylmalate dehydratase large subunit [bacterium]